MLTSNLQPPKITSGHLSRVAIVYIRQSSMQQVRHNLESQRLQYSLADRARALGWRQVEIIDDDLGASASAGARRRDGFQKIVASVSLGTVGIVLCRELSRLSRTDKDLCQLLEICQIHDTLIADAENVYDLAATDDQLVLGIKGTLSVVELRVLKMRLLQGMQEKARRGALVRTLAPGYVADADGAVVKDPDRRVQEAVGMVFSKFRELWSVRQVFRWFHDNGIELPVNKVVDGRFKVMWQLPKYSFVKDILQNPLYAGAYVYGRRPRVTRVQDGEVRRLQGSPLPLDEAKVFLKNHHEPYLSWVDYERNLQMIRNNTAKHEGDAAVTAVRAGHGILTGLLRCGRCGRKMHVRYWGKSGTAARYLCKGDFDSGGKYCLGFGGATFDKRVSEEIVKAISPLGVEASLEALARRSAADDDRRRAMMRRIEQLEFEATRAFEQYDKVDPRNRLVADELERRWNAKLEEVNAAKTAMAGLGVGTTTIAPREREMLAALGRDFAGVWATSAVELKKKIIRTIVTEVIIDASADGKQLSVTMHWQGGCHTRFEMAKPLSATAQKTALEDVELIRRMADRYGDDEIARVLNKLGRTTGKGLRWNMSRVASARKTHGISAPDAAAKDADILALNEAARLLDVSDTSLMKLIRAKLLAANQIAPYAPLEIRRQDLETEPVAGILRCLKTTGRLVLSPDPSSGQRSLFE